MKNDKNNEVSKGKSLEKEDLGLKVEITTFTSSFTTLRTTRDQYGRPVFCLRDACAALELKNPSDVKKRLKADGIVRINTVASNHYNNFLYITESNLYRLAFQSRKEIAERFTDWVTEVVLPSIRKFGRYEIQQITSSSEYASAFLDNYEELEVKNKILEHTNEETKAAREYVRRALNSGVLNALEDVSAILRIKGINTQKLLSMLRSSEVLNESNLPNQEFIDKGWFRIDSHSYMDKKAGLITKQTCFVYKTGINGIKNILNKWAGKK